MAPRGTRPAGEPHDRGQAQSRSWAARRINEKRSNNMRVNLIVTILTGVLAVVAVWGLTVVIVPQPKDANASPAPDSMDAMQKIKRAGNLPVEQFGAI